MFGILRRFRYQYLLKYPCPKLEKQYLCTINIKIVAFLQADSSIQIIGFVFNEMLIHVNFILKESKFCYRHSLKH